MCFNKLKAAVIEPTLCLVLRAAASKQQLRASRSRQWKVQYPNSAEPGFGGILFAHHCTIENMKMN